MKKKNSGYHKLTKEEKEFAKKRMAELKKSGLSEESAIAGIAMEIEIKRAEGVK